MKIAFVSPRLHEPGTVGGAETLLWSLALDAVALGHEVELLCTCAKDHRTWANELPPGAFARDGLTPSRLSTFRWLLEIHAGSLAGVLRITGAYAPVL